MPTHTPSTGRPAADASAMIFSPPIFSQSRHAGLEGADAGHHETVGVHRRIGVGRHLDVRADAFQRALSRAEVSRAVVEDNHGLLAVTGCLWSTARP